MIIKQAFGMALKQARKSKNLTQEDFSDISSRTYVSTLERGNKSVTLEKMEALAKTMDIHPVTLLVLAYQCSDSQFDLSSLLERVRAEIHRINLT